jgi:histone H3/H4
LEEIIVRANRIGVEYVEKRREAERLELMRPSVRSQIMNRIESLSAERISESRLRRLAEAHEEYVEHIERIAEARAESEKLRVRYESYRNLFDARRTLISYRKAELRALS